MAKMIKLPTFADPRGKLTTIDRILPFEAKRIYYIYGASGRRGGHRHKKNVQALVCVSGRCDVYVNDGSSEQTYALASPSDCLILETKDWHTMDNFSEDAVLLVMASEPYDREDYIDEEYR